MNYSKTELILLLRPIVMQRTGKTLAEANDHLEILAVDELRKIYRNAIAIDSPEIIESQEKLRQIQAESQRESAFFQIFRTAVRVGAVDKVPLDNAANRQVIESWVHEDQGEQLTPAWFAQVLRAQPQLARQLSWQSADVLDPVKRRQAEAAQADEDRQTFNSFARANGYSEVEANFRLTVEALGSGFNEYQLSQAVQSNALQLAQASPEELARFSQEAYEERVEFLTNRATPAELRAAAKAEAEQLSARFQRQAQMSQIKTRQQAEIGQHPVLPETNTSGVKLDAAFFKNLADTNISVFKQYCVKYGFAAISARLNGVR